MTGNDSQWSRRSVLKSMAAGTVGAGGTAAVVGSASASYHQIEFWALDQTTYVVEYDDGSTTQATTASDTISHDNDITSIEVENNSYASFQFDSGYPSGDAYDEVVIDGESGTQYQIDFTAQGLTSSVPQGQFMDLEVCQQDTSAGTTCRETFGDGWMSQTSQTLEITVGKITEIVIRDGDATVEFSDDDGGSGSSSSSGSSGWW